MKKLILACLGVVLMLLGWPLNAQAGLTVKAGLVWDLAGKDYLGFEVVQGTYSLQVNGKVISRTVEPGAAYRAGSGPWGLVLFDQGRPWGFVEKIKLEPLHGKLPVFKLYSADSSKKYRGTLEISRKPDGSLLIVNTLGEEEYLYGVVPIEMSNSWAAQGIEALKAQAVAARTYLHSHYDSKLTKGYNITDSPNIDQAYAGYGAEGAASRAVDATAGEVLVDKVSQKPINTSYHSHSGGHTEDSENVWGGIDPHLRGKEDPFSQGQGFLGDKWSFTVSAMALGKPLGLGPVVSVNLEKYPSGRVKNVSLTDATGKTASKSGRQLAGIFYPRNRGISNRDFLGNFFSVTVLNTGDADSLITDPLDFFRQKLKNASGPRLDRVYTPDTPPTSAPSPFPVYVFTGSGWGHGVGMSQWGAYGMARKGYTYRQILEYYYTDVTVVKAK